VRPFELAAAAIVARPPAPISAAVVFLAALFLAKVSTCGEKETPSLFYFFTEPHTVPPLAARRPSTPFGAMPQPPPYSPVQAHV
jgi:hypothetical protein